MPEQVGASAGPDRVLTVPELTHVSRFAEAKSDLLDRAAATVGDWQRGMSVRELLDLYYRFVTYQDLAGREPADIAAAPLSQVALAETRPVGRALVHVSTPSAAEVGGPVHTMVQVVTDDMPFLVDSVLSELSVEDRPIYLVVHPQIGVRRDVMGELIELCDPTLAGTGERPDAAEGELVVESWIYVEIDRETELDDVESIETSLERVLSDVREAVEDWPRMRQTALSLAESLRESASSLPVGRDEVDDAVDLLRWLPEDHFTFLGYREYALERVDGDETLVAVTGTGLGILRSDPKQDPISKLAGATKVLAREKRLLTVTKANSRSTVHRPVFLDYIGIKRFDADGNVDGERRFLGLFTASAYTASVRAIPFLRRKVDSVVRASGLAPRGHSGRDLMQILETYPRDELFQMTADQMLPFVMAVLQMQERRQVRLLLRTDTFGRFVSALVYFPRDRYSTDVRLAMEAILRRTFGGVHVDYSARVSESVLARLHFIVRVAPGATIPIVDHDDLEQKLGRSDSGLDRRLHRRVGRTIRGRASGPTRASLRRRVSGGI